MKIKQELLNLLISYGMDSSEIEELAGRLINNAKEFIAAKENAQRQLEHTEVVKEGLLKTIKDAESRAVRAETLLSKIVENDV